MLDTDKVFAHNITSKGLPKYKKIAFKLKLKNMSQNIFVFSWRSRETQIWKIEQKL